MERKKTEERRKDELAEVGGSTVPGTSSSSRRPTMPLTSEEVLSLIASKALERFDVSRPEERNSLLRYLEDLRKVLNLDATVLDTSIRIPAMATNSSESGTIGHKRISSNDELFGLSAFKSFSTFDVSRPEDESGQAMPERLLECQSDKTKIHEGIVTRAATIWDLKQGAAYLIFPPGALSEPTSIVVNKWKCSTRSPPLQEHEALVSNVIEISTNANRALEFNVKVTLFLCHSAADLQGYELVLKRLVNNGNNEWEDVDGTQVLEQFSEIEDEYPSVKDVPDVFPAVKAEIIECSTYAVVSRLKSSPLYTITSDGGSFNHPNYPGVLITIPKNAVPPKEKFNLQVKVQEVPSEAFDDDNVMVGPILRIACSQSVEFLKSVTIQLPVSHRDGGISQSSVCRVRILFLRSDGERKEWIEITDDLEIPPNYDGKFVRFQVERFSGYSYTLDRSEEKPTDSRILRFFSSLIWNPPRRAVFFAYFFSSGEEEEEVVLRLICCPNHLRIELESELERKLVTFSTVTSMKKMIPEYDKAFVCVSGGIRPLNEEDMNDFHLVFDGDDWCDRQLPVRVISDQMLSKVQFDSTPERAGEDRLAELYLKVNTDREASNDPQSIHDPGTSTENISASRKRKRKLATEGTSADYHEDRGLAFARTSAAKQTKLASEVTTFNNRSKDDLERLSRKIADDWRPLARRLGFREPEITAFDQENGRLASKAHQMLLAWHRREGSAATYQVLYDALCDDLVECKALAEELCYS